MRWSVARSRGTGRLTLLFTLYTLQQPSTAKEHAHERAPHGHEHTQHIRNTTRSNLTRSNLVDHPGAERARAHSLHTVPSGCQDSIDLVPAHMVLNPPSADSGIVRSACIYATKHIMCTRCCRYLWSCGRSARPSAMVVTPLGLGSLAPLNPLCAQRRRKVRAAHDLRSAGEHVRGEGLVEARLNKLPRRRLEHVMEGAACNIVDQQDARARLEDSRHLTRETGAARAGPRLAVEKEHKAALMGVQRAIGIPSAS